jgi:hypothetical protein
MSLPRLATILGGNISPNIKIKNKNKKSMIRNLTFFFTLYHLLLESPHPLVDAFLYIWPPPVDAAFP